MHSVLAGFVRSAADQAIARARDLAEAHSAGIWKRAEHELEEHFARLKDALRDVNLSTGAGGHGTIPDHPLHWYGSFSKPRHGYATIAEAFSAPPAREIIISADVQRDHDTLLYACRISLDGRTLQEGPAGTIATPYGAIGSYASIRSALQEIAGFIDDSEPFIREQLRALV